MIERFSAQKGLGLIELMISITLGLFLISGTIGVLISGKSSYTLNNELTWIQDNARFATSILKKDIRMAGFFGCGSGDEMGGVTSTLNTTSGTDWQYDFRKPVFGWDGDEQGYPVPEFPSSYDSGSVLGMPNSDLLTIRRAGGGDFTLSDNDPANAATIDMVGTHPFVSGDILVITDCDQTTVFQVTGGNPQQIVHNQGQGSPGNCSKALGVRRCSPPSDQENKRVFYGDDGAFILRLSAHAYFVSEGADGTPSLFHRKVVASSGDSDTEDEELAQGVENMQVFYGFDSTSVDGNNEVSRYVNADDLDPNGTDWLFVRAVRVHLLFRSFTQAASEPQDFRFIGETFTPSDRFLRQEFITTVQIRN